MPEEAGRNYIRIRGSFPGSKFKICNVLIPDCTDAQRSAHQRELEETRANAHLIAAAPGLLSAIERLLDAALAGNDVSVGHAAIEARTAIANAKGLFQQ